MPSIEPMLVKPARFAKLIDTSRANVYNLITRGELKSVRIGGSIRIPIDELDRLRGKVSEKEAESAGVARSALPERMR